LAEIEERVSPFWTMWILVRVSLLVTCGSVLPSTLLPSTTLGAGVFRSSESGGMGEVAGEDTIGWVGGEGFIFEAA